MRDLSDDASEQSTATPYLPGFSPLDEPPPADARAQGVQATGTRLDDDLVVRLHAWADEGRVTVQRLLLAALACVVARYGDCSSEVTISVAMDAAAETGASRRRTIALRPGAATCLAALARAAPAGRVPAPGG